MVIAMYRLRPIQYKHQYICFWRIKIGLYISSGSQMLRVSALRRRMLCKLRFTGALWNKLIWLELVVALSWCPWNNNVCTVETVYLNTRNSYCKRQILEDFTRSIACLQGRANLEETRLRASKVLLPMLEFDRPVAAHFCPPASCSKFRVNWNYFCFIIVYKYYSKLTSLAYVFSFLQIKIQHCWAYNYVLIK